MTREADFCTCTPQAMQRGGMTAPELCPVHGKDWVKVTERKGSKDYYKLLDEMADLHEKKHHDYANDENPVGNYHFAGMVANLFSHSAQDAGFVGRIAEKIYRLATLEGGRKEPLNESVADTERDIAVIVVLWMADRRARREKKLFTQIKKDLDDGMENLANRFGLAKCPKCLEIHSNSFNCQTKSWEGLNQTKTP